MGKEKRESEKAGKRKMEGEEENAAATKRPRIYSRRPFAAVSLSVTLIAEHDRYLA